MIDWKRFAILTTIRTVIAAGVTTGLCFLFPPAIPYLIGGNVAALTLISGGQIAHAAHNDFSDIPSGDLEFYDIPKPSKLQKVETAVIDKVEECLYSFEDKRKAKRQAKKQAKENGREIQ